jgi:hypothetical protein
MAYLNIKIDSETRERIKTQAKIDRRSLGAEALYLIEKGFFAIRSDTSSGQARELVDAIEAAR